MATRSKTPTADQMTQAVTLPNGATLIPAPGQDASDALAIMPMNDADEPLDALEMLHQQIGTLPGDATLHVYRMREGMKDAFIYQGSPNDFADTSIQAFLQSRFGGGDYRVRAWRRGVRGFVLNEVVSIDGAERVSASATQSAPGVLQVHSGDGNAVAMIAQAMQAGFSKLGEMIIASRPQQADPMAQLTQMAQMMAILRPLFAPPQSAQTDPLSTLRTAMEFVKEMQPPGKGEVDGMAVLYKAVESFAPAIADAVTGRMMGSQPVEAPPVAPAMLPGFPPMVPGVPPMVPGVPPMVPGVPPMMPSGVPPVVQPNPQPNGANPAMNKLKLALGFLLPMAQADADPGTYAGMALDMVPEADLRALLAPSDWWQRLQQVEPRIAQYQDWYGDLRAIIMNELDAPPEGEPGSDLTGANDAGISAGSMSEFTVPQGADNDGRSGPA